MKRLLTILATAAALFSACDRIDEPVEGTVPDEEKVQFSVDPSELTIDVAATSGRIYLKAHVLEIVNGEKTTSDLEWHVEQNDELKQILSVTPSSGQGDATLEIRFVGACRQTDFRIVSGELACNVFIWVEDTSPRIEIPDPQFKAMLRQYDTDGDGEISEYEARRIDRIEIDTRSIHSLKGIEYFKNLNFLRACGQMDQPGKITDLDLRQNTALEEVDVCWNNLTVLDVSNCQNLSVLMCSDNYLTSLDLTGCTSLNRLDCSGNKLRQVPGLEACTALEHIECYANELTFLNLIDLPVLHYLSCFDNEELAGLTLSEAKNLRYLDISKTGIGELDLSDQHDLQEIHFGRCEMITLDLTNCTSLVSLSDTNPDATLITLKLSGCSALTECLIGWKLKVGSLWRLDLNDCTALKKLIVDYQHLREIDLSGCPALEEFHCEVYRMGYAYQQWDPRIEKIDVSNNPKLRILDCGGAEYVRELDLSSNADLEELVCRGTGIATLDLRHNPKLRSVDAETETLGEIILLPGQQIEELSYYESTRIVYRDL